MTRAPLWFHLFGWLVLCAALTAAMIITASADEVLVCDQDIAARSMFPPPKDGYRLKLQYFDPLTKQWYAEFVDDRGSLIVVRQTLSEAFWTEANQ